MHYLPVKMVSWLSGMGFMAGVAVLFPPDVHDIGTATILFGASLILALVACIGER